MTNPHPIIPHDDNDHSTRATNTILNSILHQILYSDSPAPNDTRTNVTKNSQSSLQSYNNFTPSSPTRTRTSTLSNSHVNNVTYEEEGSFTSTIASSKVLQNLAPNVHNLATSVTDARAARSLGHLGLVSLIETALGRSEHRHLHPFYSPPHHHPHHHKIPHRIGGVDAADGVSEFSFQSEMVTAGGRSSDHVMNRDISSSLVLDDEEDLHADTDADADTTTDHEVEGGVDVDVEDMNASNCSSKMFMLKSESNSWNGTEEEGQVEEETDENANDRKEEKETDGVIDLPSLPAANTSTKAISTAPIQMYGSDYARALHLHSRRGGISNNHNNINNSRHRQTSSISSNNSCSTNGRYSPKDTSSTYHAKLPPLRPPKPHHSSSSSKPKVKMSMNQLRTRWNRSTTTSSGSSGSANGVNLDSQGVCMTEAVACGPVTDLIATSSNETLPNGSNYYKVPIGSNSNIVLWMRKEGNWNKALTRPLVTALTMIHPDKQEFVPPGYCVVRRWNPSVTESIQTSHPADFGSSGGQRLYLCYRRSREGNPITDVQFLHPSRGHRVCEQYTVLEKTMFNYSAALFANQSVYLAYRQRLAHIECLRPDPLVYLASHRNAMGYYTIGGGVVSCHTGSVHPLQRGRHPMYSAASVQQRLGSRLAEVPEGVGYVPSTYLHIESSGSLSAYSNISSDASTASIASTYATPNGTFLDHLPLPLNAKLQPYDVAHVQPLIPILTILYTQHGHASFVALKGLVQLLTNTSYFQCDLNTNDKNDYPITLLDISIMSVCEIVLQARESHFALVLDFVQHSMHFTKARLHSRTLGYVARMLIYLLNFEGSVHGNVLDDQTAAPEGLLQRTLKVWKDWVSYIHGDIAKIYDTYVEGHDVKPTSSAWSKESMVRELVEELVEGVAKKADVAWHTQLLLQQIQRSGGSEVFWHDLTNTTGASLFRNESQSYLMGFATLGYLCKIAGAASDKNAALTNNSVTTGNAVNKSEQRDLHTKLHALDVILHYLHHYTHHLNLLYSSELGNTEVMESCSHAPILRYTLRRLLSQLLFRLLPQALSSTRLYARCMKILSTCVQCAVLRKELGVELYVLLEKYVLEVLALDLTDVNGPTASTTLVSDKGKDPLLSTASTEKGNVSISTAVSPTHVPLLEHRLIALTLTHSLFSQHTILPLNYTLHLPRNTANTLYTQLLQTLSTLLQQGTHVLQKLSDEGETHVQNLEESVRLLQSGKKDLAVGMEEQVWCVQSQVLYLARYIVLGMFQAVHAAMGTYPGVLTSCGSVDGSVAIGSLWSYSTQGVSAGGESSTSGVAEEDEEEEDDDEIDVIVSPSLPSAPIPIKSSKPQEKSVVLESLPENDLSSDIEKYESGIDVKPHVSIDTSEPNPETELLTKFYANSNYHKGLIELLEKGVVHSPDPMVIASFLRLHLQYLNPEYLGDFLSLPMDEHTKNASSKATLQGSISKLDTDTIRYKYIRTISFEGMNLDNALRHLLTSAGFRLPGEAQKIDRIMSTFANCYWQDNAGDILRCPFQDEDQVYLVAFAVIMLNTDLHRASTGKKGLKKMTKAQFLHNIRGGGVPVGYLEDTYMSSMYDSIARVPIELQWSTGIKVEVSSIPRIIGGIPTALELLRALSLYSHTPPKLPHSSKIDNLRVVFQNTWEIYCGIIDITMDAPMRDSQCWLSALDVLRYALCSAVLFQLKMPMRRFARQLGRVMFLLEHSGADQGDALSRQRSMLHFYTSDQAYTNSEWYQKLENSQDSQKSAFDACSEVYQVIRSLKKSLELDTRRTRELKRTVGRIAGGSYLLHDTGRRRQFIMEGNLIKQGPSGKLVKRRLFLFTDRLLYTSRSSEGSNLWKINGDLLLTTTKVSDCDTKGVAHDAVASHTGNPAQKAGGGKHVFRIDHPNKSFLLFAPTADDKKLWMKKIQETIDKCFHDHMS